MTQPYPITSDATFLDHLAAARQELVAAQAEKRGIEADLADAIVSVKHGLLDNPDAPLGKSEDVRNIQFAYAIAQNLECAQGAETLQAAQRRVWDAEVALEILKDERRQRELVARERLAEAASGSDAFSLPHLMQRAEA